jgi:hypothetical protein
MKIIDAHMHYFAVDGFDYIAKEAGHENTAACWQKICEDNGIIFSVAMGNSYVPNPRFGGVTPRVINLAGPFNCENYNQPANVGYCLGVESDMMTVQNAEKTAMEFEYYLERDPHCVGIKFYMGYNSVYLNDPRHQPLFELAKKYKVPVAMHSGETANHNGKLKYAHPLTVDDAASEHPDVNFVICHFGNPWMADAVVTAAKNENVFIDLSGLLEGRITEEFLQEQKVYFDYMRMWIHYLENWEKFLYGSDWPLVNIPDNIKVLASLIPEKYHDLFFYKNALHVYSRINECLKKGTNQ